MPLDWSSLVVGQGGWSEVNFVLVLIPTLNPVIFGSIFVFDHGQFDAHRDANIGMEPEVLPPEKNVGPLLCTGQSGGGCLDSHV